MPQSTQPGTTSLLNLTAAFKDTDKFVQIYNDILQNIEVGTEQYKIPGHEEHAAIEREVLSYKGKHGNFTIGQDVRVRNFGSKEKPNWGQPYLEDFSWNIKGVIDGTEIDQGITFLRDGDTHEEVIELALQVALRPKIAKMLNDALQAQGIDVVLK